MAEFNISNCKIDQLNDAGANLKIENNQAPVFATGRDHVEAAGSNNNVQVGAAPQRSWLDGLWSRIKTALKYITG